MVADALSGSNAPRLWASLPGLEAKCAAETEAAALVEALLRTGAIIEPLDRYGLCWEIEIACVGDGGVSIDSLPDWLVAVVAIRDARAMRLRNQHEHSVRLRRRAIHLVGSSDDTGGAR